MQATGGVQVVCCTPRRQTDRHSCWHQHASNSGRETAQWRFIVRRWRFVYCTWSAVNRLAWAEQCTGRAGV